MLQNLNMGVKRKLDDIEPVPESMTLGYQRQSILNISMCKLRKSPTKRVEPPLLRSVLILNTLKYIENELKKEGVPSVSSESAFTIPDADPQSVAMDVLPSQDTSLVDSNKMDMEVSPCPAQFQQIGPLPSIDTFVGSRVVSSESKPQLDSPVPTVDICKSSNFDLIDSSQSNYFSSFRVEEMLSDIDFTFSDFDVYSSIATGMKLTPLSAEDVVHSFPHQNGSPNENYTNILSSGVSPFCKSEAAFDDLENIMQILVGS
ncbi:hypothetical protein ACJMK2_038131 [Sinanodonta woodiana]|uniref:SERTA domain-containing protein n=1 Tax=Sinanodonta woodiana TaxID=1069815 RepID=A0ABD3WNZ3_SINWO